MGVGKVSVFNVRDGWLGKEGVYVGRRCEGFDGSVLGNRFVMSEEWERDGVVEKYRVWLWGEVKRGLRGKGGEVWRELNRLGVMVMDGKDVRLGCWCSPKNCHGHVIGRCLLVGVERGWWK